MRKNGNEGQLFHQLDLNLELKEERRPLLNINFVNQYDSSSLCGTNLMETCRITFARLTIVLEFILLIITFYFLSLMLFERERFVVTLQINQPQVFLTVV